MIKKLVIFILLVFILLITSCEDNKLTLPNLDGLSREEITAVLDEKGIKYSFKFSSDIIRSEDDLNKFVCYDSNLKAGDKINPNYLVYVYTTVLPLNPHLYRDVSINFEYEGKSFIDDGVGKVILVRCIDGDTAWFKDANGTEFKLRFLGVDTPETTIQQDPWGKAASNFTASFLQNASEIVIEGEGSRTESYGRYLGFVWVDGMLLNLRLVEEAYTNSTLSKSKYEDYFLEAAFAAKATGRRFYGETDPNYNYDTKRFK